jgi:hypothetical protein
MDSGTSNGAKCQLELNGRQREPCRRDLGTRLSSPGVTRMPKPQVVAGIQAIKTSDKDEVRQEFGPLKTLKRV